MNSLYDLLEVCSNLIFSSASNGLFYQISSILEDIASLNANTAAELSASYDINSDGALANPMKPFHVLHDSKMPTICYPRRKMRQHFPFPTPGAVRAVARQLTFGPPGRFPHRRGSRCRRARRRPGAAALRSP